MAYESMPDLAELEREAANRKTRGYGIVPVLPNRLPEGPAERVAHSAAFMLGICEVTGRNDPQAAFRDTLRELMHASVEFGVNWTEEERHAWQDVRRERG